MTTMDGRPGVLMLTKGLGRGGAERLLAGLVDRIDRDRFRVEVAYLLPVKDAFVPEITAAGVPVHCLDAPRAWAPGWLPRLRRLVSDREVRLVHTHMPLPAAQARAAFPRRSAPVFVHTEHNLWDRYRWPTRRANALTYRRNAAVMAVSDGVAASVRSRVPVETLRHGVDLTRLRRGPAARDRARRSLFDPLPTGPVIGTVGNFTAKKDQATLLQAFAELRAGSRPHARLVLVGSGPLEDRLRRRAEELGVAEAVTFTGMRSDVYDLLPGFDIFVLSSRFEGLPIALLEAMGSGVAPVATRVGGIPEVVTDGRDGLLVPPADVGALVAALDKAADADLRDRLATAAAARAGDFDLAGAVARLEAIYARVLGIDGP